ncbi:hypothetical protein NM688_g694 [Phlebia brevispora]|uniref:Uncharacterized protein n=1 Tax=Phlebia brevispora TaxID=194682 RepID=A0ACC1TDG2_9APHY|nr:hypothetical protein NM688_g694 [Phlebia brevispora]
MRALCPTCRTPFSLAIPDLRTIPNKYHLYINQSIRRVFIPQDATYAATVAALKAEVAKARKTIEALSRDKLSLMDRCESQIAKANSIAKKEKDLREQNALLRKDRDELRDKYSLLKGKYRSIKTFKKEKASAASSVSAPAVSHGAVKRKSDQAFMQPEAQVTMDGSRDIHPIPKRPRLVHTKSVGNPNVYVGNMASSFYPLLPPMPVSPYFSPTPAIVHPHMNIAPTVVVRDGSVGSRRSYKPRKQPRISDFKHSQILPAVKQEESDDVFFDAVDRSVAPVAGPSYMPQAAEASGSRPRYHVRDGTPIDDDKDELDYLSPEDLDYSDLTEDNDDNPFVDVETNKREGKARAQDQRRAYVFRGERL